MAVTVTSKPLESCSDNVLTQLRHITREGDPAENVELAWRVFREAELRHLGSLRADIPQLPTNAVPIIAAAVARLEGRDPTDELERYRTTSFSPKAQSAADALGRYLADPELSSRERQLENLTYAVKHRDDRVRRACLAEVTRLKPADAADYLLKILLSCYPRDSVVVRKVRQHWVTLGKCVFVGVLLTAYFFFLPKAFWALFALHISFSLGYNLLFAVLETYWLDGAMCLTRKDRRDILRCLAHLTEDESSGLRHSLPELRALSTGTFTETGEIRRAAAIIVKRLEGGNQTLPIPAEHSSTDTAVLPISASSD